MTSDSILAIEATGLVKSFGDTTAVDGVDRAAAHGKVDAAAANRVGSLDQT